MHKTFKACFHGVPIKTTITFIKDSFSIGIARLFKSQVALHASCPPKSFTGLSIFPLNAVQALRKVQVLGVIEIRALHHRRCGPFPTSLTLLIQLDLKLLLQGHHDLNLQCTYGKQQLRCCHVAGRAAFC